MDARLKRTPGVYLTGFMGSGKTTVGRALADRLGWDFIDTDTDIESLDNETIARIFETRGEAEFRRLETSTIRICIGRIERGNPAVIALGGGAFVHPETYQMLENNGISIWLDCPFEAIESRIDGEEGDVRPLARDRAALARLYKERVEGYGRADYRVDAACDVELVVEQILKLPIWK
jgi:shikimate kinase